MRRAINIVHLYASEMNIYGDTGNREILCRRLAARGYGFTVRVVGLGDPVPRDAHLVLGGGGQDRGQQIVGDDLRTKKDALEYLRDRDVPMLMICGMYQLFGEYFRMQNGQELPGIALIDAHTVASGKRLVGNVTVESEFGELIGYENHSGRTYLGHAARPLARVTQGGGNNGFDRTEGLIQQNIVASYLHGPLLAKSPRLADWLLEKAIIASGQHDAKLESLSTYDDLAIRAAQAAKSRPR